MRLDLPNGYATNGVLTLIDRDDARLTLSDRLRVAEGLELGEPCSIAVVLEDYEAELVGTGGTLCERDPGDPYQTFLVELDEPFQDYEAGDSIWVHAVEIEPVPAPDIEGALASIQDSIGRRNDAHARTD